MIRTHVHHHYHLHSTDENGAEHNEVLAYGPLPDSAFEIQPSDFRPATKDELGMLLHISGVDFDVPVDFDLKMPELPPKNKRVLAKEILMK